MKYRRAHTNTSAKNAIKCNTVVYGKFGALSHGTVSSCIHPLDV